MSGIFGNGTSANDGTAQMSKGISLQAFVTALSTSLVVFGVQMGLFLLLRTKLARIFKPKTYLVPERERTDPPPDSPWGLVHALLRFRDREIIKKCGLDSYFFLRYLQTLLVIFIPMALVIIPILVPINFIGGVNDEFTGNGTDPVTGRKSNNTPTGLDTLAWGNVSPANTGRYWAHLILAVLVVLWVCGVFFAELRVFVKIRQDWLTTAEHRLRASATTVLVNAIPEKWLTEEALRGLFDVFPGGIRNIWLTRDFTELLEKIHKRDAIHKQLEEAETELIRMAKRKQLKKRAADEHKARKASKTKKPTKEELLQRQQEEDAAAKVRAESGAGISSGDHHEVPHNLHDGVEESRHLGEHGEHGQYGHGRTDSSILGNGFSKIAHGLGKGVDVVEKTGLGIIGGAKSVAGRVDNELETTGGFVAIQPSANQPSRPASRASEGRHVQLPDEKDIPRPSTQGSGQARSVGYVPTNSTTGGMNHSRNVSAVSQDTMLRKETIELRTLANTTRKPSNLEEMYNNEEVGWYEFWKPPPGGFASPVPQGADHHDLSESKPLMEKLKAAIPFLGEDKVEPVEYPKAFNEEFDESEDANAEWAKWLKRSDRPTHRLANFEWTPGWLPGLPLLNKKVDTIYWCRQELARLNLEIETDQNNPERFPLMRSAFIQFNHQVAAHMACQCVIHHLPRHMAPRMVEISPNDVIWDNMAISWWAEWARTAAVYVIVAGMVILWAIPITLTSSISNIDELVKVFPWLKPLQANKTIFDAITALAGVLPTILLAILLWLVPVIMDFLARFKGAKTGAQKTEAVQMFYFIFLFVQLTLVVSISSGVYHVLNELSQNPTDIAGILAENLPSAANYFFSYMILQALSTSSGTLLQIGALIKWYIIAKFTNNTPRNKWETNTDLPNIKWGSYFPVYTNFACISLIYSVVAPVISIFAIITFSLLWAANRYSMLYVNRFTIDTGGVLYPRAINQAFTGLYVMEVCLVGLFFLVRDEQNNVATSTQAVIMIIVTILTGLYQILLNRSFGSMFRYLPITFEDEAVLRDEAFQRAQDRRLGLLEDDEQSVAYDKEEGAPSYYPASAPTSSDGTGSKAHASKLASFAPVKGLATAGTWAVRGTKAVKNQTYGRAEQGMKNAAKYRGNRRKKDLEAQRAIGKALYGGFHDEIEDLTPEERDTLVRRAFMHYALRARRPTVWIPQDDIGVSDDEIKRTREFSENIWISNEGTALDSKVRVLYGRPPPDFSEVDLINL